MIVQLKESKKEKRNFLPSFHFHRGAQMLYNQWLIFNKGIYAKYFNLLALLILVVLIPFDFLLFKEPMQFVRIRAIMIIIFSINLMLLARKMPEMDLATSDKFDPILILPGILFSAVYLFFLYSVDGDTYTIVLVANYMVVFLSTFFLHRFWKEQYTLNLASIYGLLMLAALKPEITKDCILLVIFNVISMIAAFFYRWDFVTTMLDRFHHLSTLVPKKTARYVAIAHGRLSLDDVLRAEHRFTVCLCADWRDFQKMAMAKEPGFISDLFDKYYTIVLEELDRIVPDGNYYANWRADELFVIFYNESNEDKQTMKESLKFVHSLATKIYNQVMNEFEINLDYDIGLSCGIGLLGLQGPSKMKKMTVSGEPAGRAARFQTEAKTIRRRNMLPNQYPILIMDSKLKEEASKDGIFNNGAFKDIIAETKDIKNEQVVQWQFNDQTAVKPL
tara:strand:+ start:7206 stop:8546 length:1341 start_codon:yes stop_codon:yes gene_type:complete